MAYRKTQKESDVSSDPSKVGLKEGKEKVTPSPNMELVYRSERTKGGIKKSEPKENYFRNLQNRTE